MASYQNIQTLNRRQQAKYPFDISADLKLDNYTFPCSYIKSLKLQISDVVFPLYIAAVQYLSYIDNTTATAVRYIVKDANGYICSYIDLTDQETAKITDVYGNLCGSMSFQPQLYKWSLQLIKNTVYGYMQLTPTNLPLSSFVLSCCYFKGFKGVSVGGQFAGNKITLNFTQNIVPVFTQNKIRLDLFSDYYLQTSQEPQRFITVNGIPMQGKSLIIKHNVLSNLRVLTEGQTITLAGVTDDI